MSLLVLLLLLSSSLLLLLLLLVLLLLLLPIYLTLTLKIHIRSILKKIAFFSMSNQNAKSHRTCKAFIVAAMLHKKTMKLDKQTNKQQIKTQREFKVCLILHTKKLKLNR